jgi:lipoprotein signal peptidase
MPLPADKAWFLRKNLGSSWSFTKTWQGWLVLLVDWTAILVGAVYLRDRSVGLRTVLLLVLLAATYGLCWWKGERREPMPARKDVR